MSAVVRTVAVIYVGGSLVVEGAGFRFPKGEPVDVPADVAKSLIRGDFEMAKDEGK